MSNTRNQTQSFNYGQATMALQHTSANAVEQAASDYTLKDVSRRQDGDIAAQQELNQYLNEVRDI